MTLKEPAVGQDVRIRFDAEETGWAVYLGDGEYRINNIPCCPELNIDDTVTVIEIDGMRTVEEIVQPGMPNKETIQYDTKEQFRALCELARAHGCKIEGMIGPFERDGVQHRGIMAVAFPDGVDPFRLARAVGIIDPEFGNDENEEANGDGEEEP